MAHAKTNESNMCHHQGYIALERTQPSEDLDYTNKDSERKKPHTERAYNANLKRCQLSQLSKKARRMRNPCQS